MLLPELPEKLWSHQGTRECSIAINRSQSVAINAFLSVPHKEKDVPFGNILFEMQNGLASRLNSKLREENSLVYSSGFFSFGGLHNGLFVHYALTSKESLGFAHSIIGGECDFRMQGNTSAEEFSVCRKQAFAEALRCEEEDSASSLSSRVLSLFYLLADGNTEVKTIPLLSAAIAAVSFEEYNDYVRKSFISSEKSVLVSASGTD
jgi:predicted Zn-dependent peptidase